LHDDISPNSSNNFFRFSSLRVVRIKYIKNTPICLIKLKYNDSPVWCDLLRVRHIYLKDREFMVKNGKLASFWVDSWLDEKPLCLTYPMLYELCTNKNCSVYQVKQQGWVLEFSIRLLNIIRNQWYELAHKLNQVILGEENDVVMWRWTTSRKFSVKSVYKQLSKHEFGPSFKRIWKAKLPEKNKSVHVACGEKCHPYKRQSAEEKMSSQT
jgi:hypothetical protein